MRISKRLFGLVLAAAIGSMVPMAGGISIASATAPTMLTTPVPLTADAVQTFITSYPAVKAATGKLSKKYGVKSDKSSAANAWSAWMTATAAWAELNGIVTPYGYTDFQTWLQTTISVATAYAFAKEGGAMDADMAKAVDQIQNNPSLSTAQKKMMLDQMQAATGSIAAMRPPQGNLDAVTPYLAQLKVLFH
jgi:hypothetical protein